MLSAVCVLLSLTLGAESAPADYGAFSVSRLTAVIGDNGELGEHRTHYNGLFSLRAPGLVDSPFVPLYAGLNLEHYFDARPRSPEASVFFEPRHAPMSFTRINDTTAELHQPPTPVYGVESWTRFVLTDPYYVDMEFRCVPTKAAFEGGILGVFWASYINAPSDKSIYFLRDGTLDAPLWAQFCTQEHNLNSTVRSAKDDLEIPFEATGDVLYSTFSPFRYAAPFYYGRFRDHVLIFIFQSDQIVRFAHSPSGGGRTPTEEDTNPAWDFQLIVPGYEVGKEYGLKVRLVLKPWVDRADVLKEVRAYLE